MLVDVVAAFMLLTRLPVGFFARPSAENFSRCVWAFPVVGAVVGALGGAVLALGGTVGLPGPLAAVAALAAMTALTGALHEDGLADTADGFGGATRERKLAIMRDSRIGVYGATALMLTFAARAAAIVALAASPVAALAGAGALGRAAMLIPMTLPPARPDGLAAGLRPRPGALAIGLLLGAAAAAWLLPRAAASVGVAFTVGLVMRWRASRQLGGHTGDILGATSVLAECAVLAVLAATRAPR